MTDSQATATRPVPADYQGGPVILSIAGAAALGGIVWFPLWFFGAQLLRLWAPQGGRKWLRSQHVPEYTDEQYATAMAWIPIVPIAARLLVSFDWIEPFTTLTNERKEPIAPGEMAVLVDLVLGLAIAASLTGVMRTRGWPSLLAAAGFVPVVALALVVGFAPPWEMNGFALIPLAVYGSLVSQLALFFQSAPQRRARRAAREAARIEDERIEAQIRKERGY
jgi:hypothetical protein